MTYQPTRIDTDWAANMIALLKDGGTLAYRDTKCIYTLDKVNKVMTLKNPDVLAEEFDSFVIHEQTKAVFAVLGWKVTDANENRI